MVLPSTFFRRRQSYLPLAAEELGSLLLAIGE
jgi:hypothetical protein